MTLTLLDSLITSTLVLDLAENDVIRLAEDDVAGEV